MILPDFLTVIGISPKSFGNYLLNDDESNGVKFLNNQPDLPAELEPVLLPGLAHNTSWLAAMEQLQKNFSSQFELSVSRQRYRLVQIEYMLQSKYQRLEHGDQLYHEMWPQLTWLEKCLVHFVQFALQLFRFGPRRRRKAPLTILKLVLRQYPTVIVNREERDYQNVLEMFEDFRRLSPSSSNKLVPSVQEQ